MGIFNGPRVATALVALAALLLPTVSQAADPAPVPAVQQNYQGAQYVQLTLGVTNVEEGIRLVEGQPDGLTEASVDQRGRKSVANPAGTERFFYFDVHDTYVKGGHSKVRLAIAYQDVGLTPIYVEYDSFDPLRPEARTEDVTRKRIAVVNRTNSEGWKTAFVELSDARFGGAQSGGADFRIGSGDDLVLSNVSVVVMQRVQVLPTVRVFLDGREVRFNPDEVQPFVHAETSRTLVPFRAMFNALGVTDENIKWIQETRTVEAKRGNTTLALTIDDVTVRVNGQVVPERLDQPATIVASRTVVPLRFVAEQFGLQVQWDGVQRVVSLTTAPPDPSTQIVNPPVTPQPKP